MVGLGTFLGPVLRCESGFADRLRQALLESLEVYTSWGLETALSP